MDPKPATKPNYFVFVPIIAFLGLAAIFASQLLSGKDNTVVPSALVGKPAPITELPPLDPAAPKGISTADFAGRVTVLNVFASWCVPCREEHPVLIEMAKDKRFTLVGFNYKDATENATRFLAELGNPYAVVGTDISGRAGINWGVYGIPETYVIGKDGIIRYKHVGPLDLKTFEQNLRPVIEKALASG
ncbi:MAG: DsbE family thiol:disulfide interchange protein [Rhizobiaceae bacterium]